MEDLFNIIYRCNSEEELLQEVNRHPLLSQKENWTELKTIHAPISSANKYRSINALISAINGALTAVVKKKMQELGIDQVKICDVVSLKKLMYPESETWTYQSMQSAADEVRIEASGERMFTTISLVDFGLGLDPHELVEKAFNPSNILNFDDDLSFKESCIEFCGQKKYMLLGTNKETNFYYTLVRQRNSDNGNRCWEFLQYNNKLPYFNISKTNPFIQRNDSVIGNLKRFYSYDLPAGSRSALSKDLLDTLTDFYYDPILPITIGEIKDRYEFDLFKTKVLAGKKYKISKIPINYLKKHIEKIMFSKGVHISCYLFNPEFDNKHYKACLNTISKAYFKNKFSILVIYRGLVQHYFLQDFLTNELNCPQLKKYTLIIVDISNAERQCITNILSAKNPSAELNNQLREVIINSGTLAELVKYKKEYLTYS